MREVIEDILSILKTENLTLSDKQFSKRFLNKNPTYYAFLKSANKQPSMDAMVHLWRNLKQEAEICQYRLSLTNEPARRFYVQKNLELYKKLAAKAYNAMAT
tara:strand:+ start:17 stop:322 length:306 start_codon:yes stop_codon:yes gene_type:complete